MPVRFQDTIRASIGKTLKDPASAQYIFEKPYKAYKIRGWAQSNAGSIEYIGWAVLAQVNAKNSYGGYVGFQPHHFLFRGEDIVFEMVGPDFILVRPY